MTTTLDKSTRLPYHAPVRSWLAAALHAALDPALADSVLGDLEEERRRRAARAPLAAGLWFWRTAGGVVLFALVTRLTAALRRGLFKGLPMNAFSSDFRHACRALIRGRGATLAIVLVLAIGSGLTSAMFALTDPFLLRPLPYADPDALVAISTDTAGITSAAVLPTLADWRGRTDLFVDAAATRSIQTLRLEPDDGAVALRTLEVTGNFFAVLGNQPGWTQALTGPSAAEMPLILLDRGRHAFPDADRFADRTLPTGSGSARLLGILPPSFVLPSLFSVDALVPFMPGPVVEVSRWQPSGRPAVSQDLGVVARLRPGVTPRAVQEALGVPLPSGARLAVTAQPLSRRMSARVRPLAFGALAAGLLVLFICAANVANLLVARGAYRERDLATRQALGASRWDLVRLGLVELGLLAGVGAALGLAMAWAGIQVAAGLMPDQYLTLGAPALTLRVVGFAAVSALLIVAVGALPIAALRRMVPRTSLSPRVSTEGRGVRALRFGMAAGQMAVAMILLAGAALLIRSYANLVTQDAGFARQADAVTVRYPDGLRGAPLGEAIDETRRALRGVPGVDRAAAVVGTMVDGFMSGVGVSIGGKMTAVRRKQVTPDFFDVAGSRIIEGRALGTADAANQGVVVNETLARKYWPGASAAGQSIVIGRQSAVVVGVVQDSFDEALDKAPEATLFSLLTESTAGFHVTYVLRSSLGSEALAVQARQTLRRISRDAVVTDVSSLGSRLADSVRDRAFATLVLTIFATAGLAVSAAGIIGIVAFVVARRTREIAIRMAIGATAARVQRLVLRDAILATAAGIAIGLAAGRSLSHYLESLVYGIQAGDWTTMGAAAGLMLTLAVVAAVLPARRAIRVSPTIALRSD